MEKTRRKICWSQLWLSLICIIEIVKYIIAINIINIGLKNNYAAGIMVGGFLLISTSIIIHGILLIIFNRRRS